MILSCPECKTQFLLPSTAIPVEGRKVRCSNCQHIWHQEKPFEVKIPDFSDQDFSTLPKTKADTDDIRSEQDFAAIIKKESREGILPFFAGMAIVFLAFFTYVFLTPDIPVGQGLAFDNMTVERLGDGTLGVSGAVLNTMDGKRKIPMIRMTYIGIEGVEGDSRLFQADKEILNAGESIPVSFVLDDAPTDVMDIRISFELQTGEGGPMVTAE